MIVPAADRGRQLHASGARVARAAAVSFLGWLTVTGVLLLVMALSSALLRRLPISNSLIYLACGLLIGPLGLRWLHVDLLHQAEWFERLAEIAVIVSLFVGGLKLRLSPKNAAWRAAFLLAGPVMLVSIAGVAFIANAVFGLAGSLAVLLGAILAPTDPVLASSVKVSDAADEDRLRYGLSGEAGLNDGAAFPFVILGLLWMEKGFPGGWLLNWALERLVWAVPAGLLLGYVLGRLGGRLAIFLRSRHGDVDAPNDFLALALIALSYSLAEAIGAWGFLATFAAGVGVRSAELKVVDEHPHPAHTRSALDGELSSHPPAETLVAAVVDEKEMTQPAVAAGVVLHEVVVLGDTVERLLEILLVGLVGIMIGTYWDWRAVPIAVALFFVIRPLATRLLLIGTATSSAQRWLMGWFGIRGIGSLYYLAYALNHGAGDGEGVTLISLTITTVAISIVLHGATAQPLLNAYERMLQREESGSGTRA